MKAKILRAQARILEIDNELRAMEARAENLRKERMGLIREISGMENGGR